jgi:uncharacterized coiled-coil protein SlyX
MKNQSKRNRLEILKNVVIMISIVTLIMLVRKISILSNDLNEIVAKSLELELENNWKANKDNEDIKKSNDYENELVKEKWKSDEKIRELETQVNLQKITIEGNNKIIKQLKDISEESNKESKKRLSLITKKYKELREKNRELEEKVKKLELV